MTNILHNFMYLNNVYVYLFGQKGRLSIIPSIFKTENWTKS
jgi:hypothetical protein